MLLENFIYMNVGYTASGSFVSKLKGEGYDIEDIREYYFGDNVKNINWKISAKYDKEYVNIYNQEKDVIFDIILDNNLNFSFFYPIYNYIKKQLLILKSKLSFKLNLYIFVDNSLKLISNTLIDISSFNKKNNFDLLSKLENQNPKIIISDFLFFNDAYKFLLSKKNYFGVFPIDSIGKRYPVLNGYNGYNNDFWDLYSQKLENLKIYGIVEKYGI